MMHTKNSASANYYFAAQAKSQESATAKTQKAWPRASKTGQYAVSIVSKLIYISMMLLFICNASCKIYNKFCTQQAGIYPARNAAEKCHQGQFSWRTANKVRVIACHRLITQKIAYTCVNACNMQCKEIAQKREIRLEANFKNAKSQKPSPVSGKIRAKHVVIVAKKISRAGLIAAKTDILP